MTATTITCSLCQHQIPAAFLSRHQEQDRKEIAAYTVELIKQSHPDWSDSDPTCQKCWDEYANRAAV
jgi:hypothetical protein